MRWTATTCPCAILASCFKGEVGEQATMFFLDPCGNALEFKAFKDISRLFAK
jgi:extradiol dioxygenase family protein